MSTDPELRWLREVYQPGARQLTARAVVAGMALGALMCLSNLYVVLKTGWSFGVTITAGILAWGIFNGLHRLRLARAPFGLLENNAMCSVASAAGYMTGGGNMAALPALILLTGTRPDPWALVVWFAAIAALGVFIAIPVKRQLVNVEQLPFPTGTATAEIIRSLHDHGPAAMAKARRLGLAGIVGGLVTLLRDFKASFVPWNLPAKFGLPFSIRGLPAEKWTLAVEGSLLLVGAGALMSVRTGWSMLLGAIVTYGVLAPALVARGVIAAVSYKEIVRWSLWGGAALLVSSGLLAFLLDWRSIARALGQLGGIVRRRRVQDDPLDAVEAPAWWFPTGVLLLAPPIVWMMSRLFGIPIWAGLVAIPLAVVMALVAARVTGETDTTPTKALGPVTQLVYGGLLPGNVPANVMAANVTGGAGLHAADLLTDLKSGYLLGANPRQQVVAQFFGVVAGAAMVVPAFNLLVPTPAVLGTEALPAPAALVWAGVSQLLAAGPQALHPTARVAVVVGALLGVALTLADRLLPKRARAFVPSASGLGLAAVIPGYNSIAMCLGAVLAEAYRRRRKAGDEVIVPVASGLIAGESLVGIVLAMLVATGIAR